MRRFMLCGAAALMAIWLLSGCGAGNTYNPDLAGNAASFNVTVTPSSQTVAAGGSTNYTVTLTAVNGFSQPVTLGVSGLPVGAAGTFDPASVTPTAGGATSTLTVTTTGSAQQALAVVGKASIQAALNRGPTRTVTPVGTSTLTVTATGGGLTKAANVTLVVQNNPPPGIQVTAAGSQTVQQGGTAHYSFSVTSLNGFTGTVTLSTTGLPAGATANFTPPTVSLSDGQTKSATLDIVTTANTPVGTTTPTIVGTSGTLTGQATVTLIVTAGATGPRVIATIPDGGNHGIAANATTNRVYAARLADITN